jgi:hypothetical protein
MRPVQKRKATSRSRVQVARVKVVEAAGTSAATFPAPRSQPRGSDCRCVFAAVAAVQMEMSHVDGERDSDFRRRAIV